MRTMAILFLVLAFAVPSLAQDATSNKPSVCFTSDVKPLFDRFGCNQSKCHAAAKGKGGFKLSMFGAEPDVDYTALAKLVAGRRVNRIEPAKSLFLLKATASIEHGGGKRLEVGSPEYNTLASWVAQGMPYRDENAPELVSIKVTPEEQLLEKGKAQQLQVKAVFSDGTEEDATGGAVYSSAAEEVATADTGGKVAAAGFGQSTVVVGYMRRFDTVRIIVPQPLPSPFPDVKPNNKIDELVLAKLKVLGIPPSDLCSDEEFLRRVYLDTIGTLPTPDEVRAYLADADPQKRSKLIDHLLGCKEFASFWALKWGDLFRIKSEYPSKLWPNAVQAYHHWIRDSIVNNKPYDQFATELLTSSGSNFRFPPANYYRAFLQRTPQNLAEVTALIFMGARVGCARCHAHPDENWNLDDNAGMAAFFAQVRYKASREWKEEVVYVNPRQTMRHPRTNEVAQSKFLDGDVLEPETKKDLRETFSTLR